MNNDYTNKDLSTADLAAQTGMKLTNLHRQYVSPMLGMVYFCKLDGVLMRATEARKIIIARIQEIERAQNRALLNR